MREWSARHPGRVAARQRAYREEHPELIAARKRAYREGPHRQEVLDEKRAWGKANRERLTATARAVHLIDPRPRRANAANAKARLFGQPERIHWSELPAGPWTCTYCGELSRGFDHVVPFMRGGRNILSNIVPCCWLCNRSKKDRLLSEWQGRHSEEERLTAAIRVNRRAFSHRDAEYREQKRLMLSRHLQLVAKSSEASNRPASGS